MCCSSGKVQLTEIETPPEPLHGLLIGTDPDSSLFLKSIRTFNSCFQMTSFGATEIVNNIAANGQQFNSTFKIKGQIYHKVGSLLPMPNESHKFLQIYFMGGEDSERALANRVDARCDYHNLKLFTTTLCWQFRQDKEDSFFWMHQVELAKRSLFRYFLPRYDQKNGIALAVASSGIAATLLDGGRTAHSAFKLPLNIQNNPDAVCNIKNNRLWPQC
ncbi:hypothetical protein AVEN_106799-1 [Araneus ventricosus]|uniref:ATP-dependent DNA helicase n=1 Tax=Araneus ventricosus TaxID=182803 RepID=A0A4Y2TPH3_ARAVE|nr:hypothetical protein AVEN_106799-1 [Araneus ventricosus]